MMAMFLLLRFAWLLTFYIHSHILTLQLNGEPALQAERSVKRSTRIT